ncbi:MAG: bifunctional aspartate kinase/diaminopimelate decarboxylase, partial [Lysobacterales bacterium]
MDPPARAELLAYGELLSSSIGEPALRRFDLPVLWQDARRYLRAAEQTIHTPLSVRCLDHVDPLMEEHLATQGQLHITQGFIVSGPNGETCLLGRGGSDTSAACFAARLHASALEIWT